MQKKEANILTQIKHKLKGCIESMKKPPLSHDMLLSKDIVK